MAGYIKTIKQDTDVIYPVTTAEAVIGLGAEGYSTEETVTGGTWIDGSTIYKKTINFGALPNAADKAVAHGISNLNRVIRVEAIADYGTGNTKFPIPFSSPTGLGSNVSLAIESSTIGIRTGNDRSGATAYVTIYYTKSS